MPEYVIKIITQCSECRQQFSDVRLVNFRQQQEVDFTSDQELIVEYLEAFVNSEDSECENCGEIVPEWVIGYECEGYKYGRVEDDNSHLSETEKRYRVIKLYIIDHEIDETGASTEILIANLAEIDDNEIFYPDQYQTFLFESSNAIARGIIAKPSYPVKLDLQFFILKSVNIKGLDRSQACYHRDYVDWIADNIML